MKTKINIKIFLISIIIILNGCMDKKEVTLKTILHPDGSVTQVLRIHENVEKEAFPINIDDSWKMEIDIDTSVEKPDTFFVYTKHFTEFEELEKTRMDTGNIFSVLNKKFKVRKRFLWFITTYEYTEIFYKMMEGDSLNAYLSDEDFAILKDEENDSLPVFKEMNNEEIDEYRDSLDDKYGEWLAFTFGKNVYDQLMNCFDTIAGLEKYKSAITENKDSICYKCEFYADGIDDYISCIDKIIGAKGDLDTFKTQFETCLDTYSKLHNICLAQIFGNNYNYEVEVPGIITKTTADSIVGNTAYFVVDWERFFTTDYKMSVKSKVINIWTYYVSAGIVLLALIALIANLIRKRIRNKG